MAEQDILRAAASVQTANAWVLVLVLVGLAVAAGLGWYLALKRREMLRKIAAENGLRFYKEDPFGLPSRYGGTQLCSRGHSRKAGNVIAGEVPEGDLVYFDYQYTTGSGKNRQTHRFGACALHTGLRFSKMIVRREGIFDKVKSFFGFDDVDLDHSEFNRRYYVDCDDKRFAYDVLSQRMIHWIMERPELTFELGWDYVIFYCSGTAKREKIEVLIERARRFPALLPDYLKEDRALGTAPRPPAGANQTGAGPAGTSTGGRQERGGSGSGLSFDGITPRRRKRSSRRGGP